MKSSGPKKASLWTELVEVTEFKLSYFKFWKMMLWKCCTQYVSQFGKLSSGHRTGKMSVFIPIPKKGNAKECSNYHTIALISHATKDMLKILHARLKHYMNHELPDVQAWFIKGTRDQIANICWIIEKAREFQKDIYFSLTTLKPLTVWIMTNCGKLLPVSWETCMQVKKEQLDPSMEQLIGSRSRQEYDRAIYCHLICLIYTLSTSWEMPGWMSYKLELRWAGETSTTSDMQMIPL